MKGVNTCLQSFRPIAIEELANIVEQYVRGGERRFRKPFGRVSVNRTFLTTDSFQPLYLGEAWLRPFLTKKQKAGFSHRRLCSRSHQRSKGARAIGAFCPIQESTRTHRAPCWQHHSASIDLTVTGICRNNGMRPKHSGSRCGGNITTKEYNKK